MNEATLAGHLSLALPRERRYPPERFSPIFVLATARSHSSVVTQMLGQHPDLYAFPELALFVGETIRDILNPPGSIAPDWDATTKAGLVRVTAEIFLGGQSPEALSFAEAALRMSQDVSVEVVLDELLTRVAPLAGVEKSPQTALTEESLRRVHRLYPRARYIHLARHPVTTQASMQRHWGGREWSPPDLPALCAEVWFLTNLRISVFAERLAPGRIYRVRSEDLLNDRMQWLSMLAWLGIRADSKALDLIWHPEHSPFVGVVGVGAGNDPGFVRDPTPRRANIPDRIDFPRTWNIPASLQRNVIRVAEFLGYEP